MSANYDYIIVGQGIAGTLMHFLLSQRNKKVLVIDQGHNTAASHVASGLINPITGRKYVKSWMFETLYPAAELVYKQIGEMLHDTFIKPHGIVRTLATIKEENLWFSKSSIPSYEKYFEDDMDDTEYKDLVKGAVSFGAVHGGARVDMRNLISKYRNYLYAKQELKDESFAYDQLVRSNEGNWLYGDIKTDAVIFCEGWQLRNNPFFDKLGQEAAKGEVLIVKLNHQTIDKSIKKKIFITPLGEDLFWVGSSYEWEFENAQPSQTKKQYLIEALDEMYNGSYEIVDHWAGVRPTTIDRRPLLGSHPKLANLHVFNGLGTKGASLGPYWALQMVAYLLDYVEISEEVNIMRHS